MFSLYECPQSRRGLFALTEDVLGASRTVASNNTNAENSSIVRRKEGMAPLLVNMALDAQLWIIETLIYVEIAQPRIIALHSREDDVWRLDTFAGNRWIPAR